MFFTYLYICNTYYLCVLRRNNVEITNFKKNIIVCGIFIVICISCFFAGRFIRFRRVSGTSDELISGIVLTRDEVDKIADAIGISRNSIKSAADLGRAVENGFNSLREGNELGLLCVNEIKRSIEDDKKFNANLQQTYTDYIDTTTAALDMAINRAELYERIISAYEQADGDSTKNSKKSE